VKRLWEPRAYADAPRAQCAWRLDFDWPTLDGDLTTDIAVIGGGYTGLSAALHLAEAGEQVTVLEAKAPGWGASGRNGGFCCLGGAKASDATLVRRHGAGADDAWFAAEARAVDLVADLLATHGIEAAVHSDGELVLAHRPRIFASFEAERARFARRGVAAEILAPDALRERGLAAAGIHGGLHIHKGFALDPGAYVAGLARAAAGRGADIRAQAPVQAFTNDGGGFHLTTPSGRVHAQRLLFATGGYSAEDMPPWLAGRLLPVQSSVIVTRPLTARERAAQGWTADLMAYDSRTLLHYFRLMPDGRFLFGMRGGIRATLRAEARVARRIRADFAAMFPAWAGVEIEHEWSGLVTLTARGTPFVGPVPGLARAWAALAYHGNGVAMGTYAGALAADLIRGQTPSLPFPEAMKAAMARFPLASLRRGGFAALQPVLKLADRL
jgi:glycine/D-amino acid oxidase-like deaminating enzyme